MAAPSDQTDPSHQPPVPFKTVLAEERKEIVVSRRQRWSRSEPDSDIQGGCIGLALSGGGIRSATFNLGILQGLANRGLLRTIDYLSTVSGGGYIGSWLSAWIRATSFKRVNAALQTERQTRPGDSETGEAEPIRNLRRFSSYLAPRRGLLSLDSLTLVTTYLRNLSLNLIVLVLVLSALLLLPRLVTWLFFTFSFLGEEYLFILAFLPLLLTVIFIARNLSNLLSGGKSARQVEGGPATKVRTPGRARTWQVVLYAAVPITLSAWILAAWLWQQKGKNFDSHAAWAVITSLLYGSLWLLALWPAGILSGARERGRIDSASLTRLSKNTWNWLAVILFAFVAGAAAGPLLLEILNWMKELERPENAGGWHAGIWGPPSVLLVFALCAVLHIGLTGRAFHEEVREWWSRLGAISLLIGGGWIVSAVIALYGPWWFVSTTLDWKQWLDPVLAAGWALLSVGGVVAGKQDPQAIGKWGQRLLPPVVKVAPYVFVLGALVMLACLLHLILPHVLPLLIKATSQAVTSGVGKAAGLNVAEGAVFAGMMGPGLNPEAPGRFLASQAFAFANPLGPLTVSLKSIIEGEIGRLDVFAGAMLSSTTMLTSYLKSLEYWNLLMVSTGLGLWVIVILMSILALWFASRVGVNEFSLHAGYGNRLVRAYLGASNAKRDAHPFTGFDPDDSKYRLDDLRPSRGYDGPYHLINTALNLVQGRELAWQERMAASFIFSPAFCGCDGRILPAGLASDDVGCYRPSKFYAEEPALAKAMTISGAAASPSMGYYSSKPLAFLMTVFNVRLGWWLGNPCHPKGWRSANPRFGLGCLMSELLGMTNADSRYVYLSDGGHFENLAIYELVRRRCRVIIASDAACDGGFGFNDLANAIDKCRTDFGIDIQIDIEPIRAGRAHAAIGTIHYRRRDPSAPADGVLIYLKASILTDPPAGSRRAPLDVRVYREQQPAFPHESTADQWFSEKQFEAYRALGEHVAMTVFPAAAPSTPSAAVEWFVKRWGTVSGSASRAARAPARTRPSR